MSDTGDPIDLVRAARRRISESLGHDPKRVVKHYLELQLEYEARLLYRVDPIAASDKRKAPTDSDSSERGPTG